MAVGDVSRGLCNKRGGQMPSPSFAFKVLTDQAYHRG